MKRNQERIAFRSDETDNTPMTHPARFALLGSLVVAAAVSSGAPVSAFEAGDSFRDCAECPEMVVLPAGGFLMGRDGGHPYEAPPHRVEIRKPFAIGRYEVTFDEWQACFDAGGCSRLPDDHEWGRDDRPVINVTFAETEEYVAWLAAHTGEPYRLPSDAEWEYANRGGTTTEFWWGDAPGTNRANCRDCGTPWSGRGSAPVGSFAANPFGLHDTSGNVWEWVADCWSPSHMGAPENGSARTDGDCKSRAIRGGSWYYISKNARSSWRFKNDARVKSYGIGFRVARDLP